MYLIKKNNDKFFLQMIWKNATFQQELSSVKLASLFATCFTILGQNKRDRSDPARGDSVPCVTLPVEAA